MTNQTIDQTERLETLNDSGAAIAMAIIYALKSQNIDAELKVVYKDYGAEMLWETIIVESGNGGYQALSPSDHDEMNSGSFKFSKIDKIVADAIRLTRRK